MKYQIRHITVAEDPPPVVVVERRRHPDRRADWRGGRRDRDWLSRPLEAWSRQTLWSRFSLPRFLRRRTD